MKNNHRRELAGHEPDMANLVADFDACASIKHTFGARAIKNLRDIRRAEWDHQTSDGRKHAVKGSKKPPFPWEGASDKRVHLADLYCLTEVARHMLVWEQQQIEVYPTEVNDADWAKRMTSLLRWQRYSQIREYYDEALHLANLGAERGAAVMGVWWKAEQELGYQEVTPEQVSELALSAQRMLHTKVATTPEGIALADMAELPAIISDPGREALALAIASKLFPQTTPAQLRKGLRALREGQVARVVRSFDRIQRPTVRALAVGEDVFLPSGTIRIDENTRAVHVREWVTETTLVSRARSEGWSQEWLAQVLKRRGNSPSAMLPGRVREYTEADQVLWNERDKPIELLFSYQRQYDENDVPGIYCTVWNYSCGTSRRKAGPQPYAKHELLNYDHGQYPFVLYLRDFAARITEESRGIPEVSGTWQSGIKGEWDQRSDRSSITTVPPSYYPVGHQPPEWGPRAKIPTNTPEAYGFFKGPMWDPGSKEIEGTIQRFADRYHACVLPDGSNTEESLVLRQALANRWMHACREVDQMILQLDQQFLPDELFYRVIGSENSQPLRATRREIQGGFDIGVYYNVANLNGETVKEKLAMISESLRMDTEGTVIRSKALQVAYNLIDPNLGERILKPAQEAEAAEIDDEKNVFARMWAGIDTDVRAGQNHARRLQWLIDHIQRNPAAQQRASSDQVFAELLQKRLKQLQHQTEQIENAKIGTLGA